MRLEIFEVICDREVVDTWRWRLMFWSEYFVGARQIPNPHAHYTTNPLLTKWSNAKAWAEFTSNFNRN